MDGTLQDSAPKLAIYATKAAESRGRLVPEPRSPTRSEFQRDRDRILHCGAFRKLQGKMQVFVAFGGDYHRTRLTHSLEVAQIAGAIGRALGLDEDLTTAIALAHDLGHTCFGHAGEDALAEAMRPYGGFSHNEQTFRILTQLEQRYARFDGLNLSWETLEGIVKHNGPITPDHMTPTLKEFCAKMDLEVNTFAGPEAQVAAIADDIAYNTHDIDDGHHAGLFQLKDLKDVPLFGPTLAKMQTHYPDSDSQRLMHETVRDVIGQMIDDLRETTRANLQALKPKSAADVRHAKKTTVELSPAMAAKLEVLRNFLHPRMYRHEDIKRMNAEAQGIVKNLFDAFMADPARLPEGWREQTLQAASNMSKARVIADYIAGMTDLAAVHDYQRLFPDRVNSLTSLRISEIGLGAGRLR